MTKTGVQSFRWALWALTVVLLGWLAVVPASSATATSEEVPPATNGRIRVGDVAPDFTLQTIDGKWREHLLTLEHLRSVVGFRGYAQRDPLNEYKTESFQLFEGMIDSLRDEVTQKLGQVRPMTPEEQEQMMQQMLAQQQAMAEAQKKAAEQVLGKGAELPKGVPQAGFDETKPETWGDPGRNDPCPCGSGKKFKHCHGSF